MHLPLCSPSLLEIPDQTKYILLISSPVALPLLEKDYLYEGCVDGLGMVKRNALGDILRMAGLPS